MFKKIIFTVLVLLFSVSLYFGYKYLNEQKQPEFNIYKTIPLDVNFIVEGNNLVNYLSEIKEGNKLWQELTSFPSIVKLESDLEFLDSLSKNNSKINRLLQNRQLIITAHKLGEDQLGFLFFTKLQNVRDKKDLLELISVLTNKKLKVRNYNNTKMYMLELKDRELNIASKKGVLIVSSSSILVENSIRQIDVKKSLLDDNGFVRVKKTSGKNVDANLYVNFSNFNNLISSVLNGKYRSKIKNYPNLGNWIELDINLKNNAVLLNGFSSSNDSTNNYFNIFLNQRAISHKINTILPSNTALFSLLGVSNNKQYLNSYKQYLRKQNKIGQYNRFVSHYKQKYSIDFELFFEQYFNEEAGIIVTDIPNKSFSENTFIAMRTHSKSITEQEINSIITKIAKVNKQKKSDYISDLRIDKETSYKLYNFPARKFYRTFLGDIFPEFEVQYLTFIDNFMIVGSSKNMLSWFIHSYILQKTLDNDIRFKQFNNYLSSKSNFYFYTNMYHSPNFISQFLTPNLRKEFNKHIDSFRKFQALAIQFQKNSDMIYNNIFLQYVPEIKEEAVTVWESHLDTAINFKPTLVTNHYTKENEIFVQDLDNKVYLINKVGRVLWKLQLNEKINSEIYQVDCYKNGKLQILFSTKNKIHLIDRKGNYVEQYPIKLRSPSTTGLSLFDYDKSRDYRIFVPCKNKNVYLYNIKGKLINGWKFNKTDTHVLNSVQHFRAKTNDYLIFADIHRVYILNRRGDERVFVKSQFSKSKNNIFVLDKNGNRVRFVTTDTSGVVKFVSANGTVESKKVDVFSKNHYFDYQDINADGINDFIFLDKNELKVFKNDGSILFKYKFDTEIKTKPSYYYFSYDDRKLGIVSDATNELFLFNNDGTLYKGFPLKGSSPFTIGYLSNTRNQFNLIVGSKYNFLYNYAVN
ncbi:MAG: hypothetical protein MI739_07990 [Bacteroidales bacterium]|nr:hypothetical protein [Bacteroidales bacterium]